MAQGTLEWYAQKVDGTYSFSVGDRGRVVFPAELRHRHAWGEGTALIAYETEDGVVVTTREALLARVRQQLAGPSLAEQLIAEHRVDADLEDSQ